MQVTDDDLRGAYEQARASYNTPEKRSAEVVLLPDEAKAKALAGAMAGRRGLGQPSRPRPASDGGTPVDLTDSTRDQIPSPELADAVFAAAPDVVGAAGEDGARLVRAEGDQGHPGRGEDASSEARDELRARVIADKAADLIYDRANKVEDLLAGGVTLDDAAGRSRPGRRHRHAGRAGQHADRRSPRRSPARDALRDADDPGGASR